MCKTIKHRVRFKAPPETIYDLLADSRRRTEITGRECCHERQGRRQVFN